MKYKTLKIRVKDKHGKQLERQARSVNFVWNYLNELSCRAIKEKKLFLSGYDLQKYTAGSSKELGLRSGTIDAVCSEYALKRRRFKRSKLNWRKSHGTRRSLGWIPLKKGEFLYKNNAVVYLGKPYQIWDSYGLENYELRSGSFNEDARGRWYFNVCVEVRQEQSQGKGSVGIDLGCKDAATDSNGEKLEGRNYRALEQKLGIAQRARNKTQIKTIHAKIKNRRKDQLHKYSRKLVNENAAIFVGNVNSQSLVKTKMAKSVLDAGWGMFKTMLEYKCDHAGVVFEEVNEAYTTQTCSCCGCISDSSPKGRAGLGIREWACAECGAKHDRDVNAAKNILAVGHGRLAGEISNQIRCQIGEE